MAAAVNDSKEAFMGALGVLLFAIGAVLTFALNVTVREVNLDVVGVILMGVGVVAFLVGVVRDGPFWRTRHERHVSADGRHEVDETHSSTI
jgi:hypothetical protein